MAQSKGFFGDVKRHLMTGVSFMLPAIVVYALFMVLGQVGGAFGEFAISLSNFAKMLIVPLLSAYIAFSIAGKLALVPAIIIGLMSDQMGMGFIGGLVVGLLTGYLIKIILLLVEKAKGGHTLDLITGFILGPIVGTMIMGLIVYFLIAAPVASMMKFLNAWLVGLSGISVVLISVILAAFLAFDMGGPFNKVAYSFMILASTEGAFHIVGPALVAITVPPLALGISTLVSKKKYDEEERAAGKTALVLSAFGLTEGAIPFAATDPLRGIPSIIFGSVVGSVSAALFGVANTSVVPSLMGIFFGMAGTYGILDILLYILSHCLGAAAVILILHFWKKDAPVED